MQDFTGVPAVVDLAAMRDGMKALGGDPQKINPLVPVDLVIDHSVMVDAFGTPQAFAQQRRASSTSATASATSSCAGARGPSTISASCRPAPASATRSISNILAQTVWTKRADGTTLAYPDTLVGTDSHTTMVNGLAVLGWGVGGIEAEAAMLGQPLSMLIPEVVGFKLTGKLTEGVTATDLVLTVTQMLRKKGVVGKFVEFFGPGLDHLPLADRATIANMAPEYGATCGFFPVDKETLDYLDDDRPRCGPHRARRGLCQGAGPVARERRRRSGLHRHPGARPRHRRAVARRAQAAAGPGRALRRQAGFAKALETEYKKRGEPTSASRSRDADFDIGHGDVVIAAITSCTNTSNPSVLIAAGLLAKKARREGPDHQAVGEDLAGARDRRSSPTTSPRPACSPSSTSSASISSATAAPPASATRARLRDGDLRGDQREGHRRRRRAVGQPQLRGPRQPRRAGQLPRLAAAGRRLCAGRLGEDRPHERAARHRQRRQAGLS